MHVGNPTMPGIALVVFFVLVFVLILFALSLLLGDDEE